MAKFNKPKAPFSQILALKDSIGEAMILDSE